MMEEYSRFNFILVGIFGKFTFCSFFNIKKLTNRKICIVIGTKAVSWYLIELSTPNNVTADLPFFVRYRFQLLPNVGSSMENHYVLLDL